MIDAEYRERVIEDAYNRDGEAELARDLPRWRNALVALIEEANAGMTRVNAEVQEVRSGPRLERQEAARVIGELQAKRRAQVAFRTRMNERLREVKARIAEVGAVENDMRKSRHRRLSVWLLSQFRPEDLPVIDALVPEELRETFDTVRRVYEESGA